MNREGLIEITEEWIDIPFNEFSIYGDGQDVIFMGHNGEQVTFENINGFIPVCESAKPGSFKKVRTTQKSKNAPLLIGINI